MSDYKTLAAEVSAIVRRAGARIMEIHAGAFEVTEKADASPLTEADLASEAIILEALAALTPDIPVVSEEAHSEGRVPDISGGRFWLVDPLDGTREFVARRREFTVNVGLIEAGAPVLGVLGVPALGLIYTGGPGGATKSEGGEAPRSIACRAAPAGGLVVVSSRSHGNERALDEFLAGLDVAEERRAGSAYKLALVAEGAADVYPRFGRTMEWDTAAGHAVLAAAGGRVETTGGATLAYAKPGFENPHFIAWGRRE